MPDGNGLTLILGGARSGKSRHAEALIEAHPAPWHYLATAQALDAEMSDRIDLHRSRRPAGWTTTEAPVDLVATLAAVPDGEPVLVDCLTLWLSNLILGGYAVETEAARLAAILAAPRGRWCAVANEVGLGIVPESALARAFRDAAGRLNQTLAATADTVLFMVAGLPLKVK